LQNCPVAVIIGRYMARFYKTEKYSAGKIALLGIFVFSLVIARLVITAQSRILLSEPVKLRHTGLSVSIPSGRGWKNQKQWTYKNNSFNLSSDFAPSHTNPNAYVQCRYYLTVKCRRAEIRFAKRAAVINGRLRKTGHTQKATFTIDWAFVKNTELMLGIFFGTLTLPDQRSLDVEVLETTGDTKLAEKVFWKVVNSIKFEDTPLLKTGKKIVEEIKNAGLNSFLSNSGLQTFLLLKDAKKGCVGFMMDLIASSGKNNQSKIQASTFLYLKAHKSSEIASIFQSDNSLDTFYWESQTRSHRGIEDAQITFNRNGVLTIAKSRRDHKETKYKLGPAAIPDIFLEPALNQMIHSNVSEIIVDLVDFDGRITPTLIKQTQSRPLSGYEFMLDFLTDRSLNQQVSLDAQGRIFESILIHRDLILQRTTIQRLINLFPERADYILQKSKMFDLEQMNPKI